VVFSGSDSQLGEKICARETKRQCGINSGRKFNNGRAQFGSRYPPGRFFFTNKSAACPQQGLFELQELPADGPSHFMCQIRRDMLILVVLDAPVVLLYLSLLVTEL